MFESDLGAVIRKAGAALLLCMSAAAVSAQSPAFLPGTAPAAGRERPEPVYSRYYFSAGGTAPMPVGGHWGDGDSGFRTSPGFSAAGAKKLDDILSYGVETAYAFAHKNERNGSLRVRVFSLTPFVRVSSRSGDRTYYGLFGAGIYHWTQPSFSYLGVPYSSDSGSSFGFTLGGGAVVPFRGPLKIGAELRWHHIFDMNGDNFNVDAADNLTPSLLLFYGF